MWKWYAAIIAAALIAYLPAINNGFIADDYVILNRIEILKTQPAYLLDVAPENFRLTSYLVFGVLKTVFGYDYRAFYLFNILLHATNCLLLCHLVFILRREWEVAALAALLFAVFQAPQEAVMWLAAMNETLMGFFVLLTLIFWLGGRLWLSAVMFLIALFSKESGLIVLLLLPLIEIYSKRRIVWSRYVALLLPAVVFGSVFAWTLSRNFQIGNGTYAVGPHAVLVMAKSIHRLFWPWGYIVLILIFAFRKVRPDWKTAALWATLIPVVMLPYIFVTYTNNIPSRQVYLASAVFLPLLAAGMMRLNASVLAGFFVLVNTVYMWTTKDAQMTERAAPTTALVEELRGRQPGPLRISGFAYPFEDVAKAAVITLPGWQWDQVSFGETCPGCLVLRWDPMAKKYFVVNP